MSDCLRPGGDFMRTHGALRAEADVRVSPPFHVDQVLFSRKEAALKRRIEWPRVFPDAKKPTKQVPDQPVWNPMALRWIDEPEKNQMTEQHLPVGAEPFSKPPPVQSWTLGQNQMGDVGA